MIKLSEASKFATAEEYSEARGTCCGVALFVATLLALGTIAALSSSLDLHLLFSKEQMPPSYAQLSVDNGM